MPKLASLRNFGSTKNVASIPPWPSARIITHGFVAGGYKNSTVWNNVNRNVHSTDTCTNLGDIMTAGAAYCDGGNSDFYFYVYNANNGLNSYDTTCWSMNMVTQASRGHTTAAWNMTASRDDLGTMVDYEHAGGRIYCVGGGSSATDRFTMSTETMASSGSRPADGSQSGQFTSTCEGRYKGWAKSGGNAQSFVWTTETYATWSNSPANDGWGKAVSSYRGHAYMKNQGNTGQPIVKFNDDTGVAISTFNVQDSGEENYQMGANKGYCWGHYNGAQNNNSYKINYDSDVSATLASVPIGHDGMSSAALASAYTITNTNYGTTAPLY